MDSNSSSGASKSSADSSNASGHPAAGVHAATSATGPQVTIAHEVVSTRATAKVRTAAHCARVAVRRAEPQSMAAHTPQIKKPVLISLWLSSAGAGLFSRSQRPGAPKSWNGGDAAPLTRRWPG